MEGMDQFKDLWIQTARERIQTLSDLLLKLEKNPDELDLVNELMRTGHSLKGESGAMGYEQIATLAHVIEDLFTGIGKGEIKFTPEIMDQLLAALDNITATVDNIEANKPEADATAIINNIKNLTGLKTEGFGKTDKTQSITGSKPAEPNAAAGQEKAPQKTETAKATEPAATTTATATTPTTAAQPQLNEAKAATNNKITTVTLKIEKLDQLLSVNEELVLLKMKLKNNDTVEDNADLKAEIHRLDRLVTDMQFYLMQARLFPISLALQTLPRLVRDTARKTNKQVRLETEGEDTTVDRTIIDHLTEAFVHMIKNCVDHGLETSEERKAVGKLEEGVIKIKAYTKENKFYTEVSDDGRGVEWDKLLRKAIEKGVFTKEETEKWTDKDKEQLLFVGGVSASDVVTDVSGRGVGLGAVKQAIQKLGGSVAVTTEVGKGTKFTLRMPMTLAIMQALLVNVKHQTFAMPSHEVIRSIQMKEEQIQSSGDIPVIVVDNNYVPLIDLAERFNIKDRDEEIKKAEPAGEETEENKPEDKTLPGKDNKAKAEVSGKARYKTVVLVRQNEEIKGCIVDKIVAEEEILVKPLGPMLKHSAYFSGVTILADGSAAPIINFEGLKWKQVTHN